MRACDEPDMTVSLHDIYCAEFVSELREYLSVQLTCNIPTLRQEFRKRMQMDFQGYRVAICHVLQHIVTMQCRDHILGTLSKCANGCNGCNILLGGEMLQ